MELPDHYPRHEDVGGTALREHGGAEARLVPSHLEKDVVEGLTRIANELYVVGRGLTEGVTMGPVNNQPGGGPNEGAIALSGYLSELIVRRRAELVDLANPEDAPDVLSRMIVSHHSGDGLSDSELVGNVFLLLIAGHETTVGLIGNMLLGLCRRRDQRQLLLDDPGLAESAVEEFLRFDGPVQRTTFRIATEDVEIGGTVIPKHGQVLTYLGSANHDPKQFENPENLDITRDCDRHVAFGQGIHFCVGSPLARLEAQIALRSFLARFPDYDLAVPDEELSYLPTVVRALSALPVHVNS